jgi:hypothetical protein
VEEEEEIDQAPVVVVHEDILESSRDGLVVAIALRHHPLLVIPISGLWSSSALHLRRDQTVEVPSKLENPVGEQEWVTPRHDPLFIAAKNREGGGEEGCERRKEVTPPSSHLIWSEVDGVLQIFLKDLPKCFHRLFVPPHPSIVSSARRSPVFALIECAGLPPGKGVLAVRLIGDVIMDSHDI